jgi:methionyl aminopeptidase
LIHYKTSEEIELIRISSLLVGQTLATVAEFIKPGIKTIELDKIGESFIRDHAAIPTFKGYNGFPGSLCISVNEEVVHGIPSQRELKDGDIVSVDCGVYLNGYHGDSAYTFLVGDVVEEVVDLCKTTLDCLNESIKFGVAGNRLGDISNVPQSIAEKKGYGVVRDLVGHGLGKNLHESPEVPNYGKKGFGLELKEGLVLAVEPMINLGTYRVKTLKDKWTIVTQDGKPSAHYEHDIAIRKGKVDILSTFEYIDEAIRKNSNLKSLI